MTKHTIVSIVFAALKKNKLLDAHFSQSGDKTKGQALKALRSAVNTPNKIRGKQRKATHLQCIGIKRINDLAKLVGLEVTQDGEEWSVKELITEKQQ